MKKIISIFISFFVMYTPIFSFAGAAESWTIEKVVYDDIGKTLNYTASRVNAIARNDYIYNAKVAVDAAKTGSTASSMIKYGLAGAAIYGIVEAVGWVIENGAVVKKKEPTAYNDPTLQYYFYYSPNNTYYPSAWDAAQGVCLYIATKYPDRACETITYVGVYSGSLYKVEYTVSGDRTGLALFERQTNPKYNPNAQPEYEPVSDEDLGQAIIDSPSAPTVIPDIYSPSNPVPRPSPAPDAVETALENANPEPRNPTTSDTEKKPNTDTDGDGVADTYDPTQPDAGETTTWPSACEWFPAACEFFKVQKKDNTEIKENQTKQLEQDKTFFEEVSDWFDWTKDDSNLPDNESPEISQLPIPELEENAISWSAQCPNDVQVPINMQGVSSTITFSWSPWCQLLSTIKPAIVASAYIGAAFIVLGLRT